MIEIRLVSWPPRKNLNRKRFHFITSLLLYYMCFSDFLRYQIKLNFFNDMINDPHEMLSPIDFYSAQFFCYLILINRFGGRKKWLPREPLRKLKRKRCKTIVPIRSVINYTSGNIINDPLFNPTYISD